MLGILGFPGGWEFIVIVLVLLLVFGKKIPGIANSLGRGIVEFKKGLLGDKDSKEKDESSNSSENKKD